MRDPEDRDPVTGVLQSELDAERQTVELADSAPEPGGPPVRVDPAMVNAESAESIRPLERG